MSLENTIMRTAPRKFTTTEESDIGCSEYMESHGLWLEEDYVESPLGDRLTAISDNLYLVTWQRCAHHEFGEFTVCSSLKHALQAMCNDL